MARRTENIELNRVPAALATQRQWSGNRPSCGAELRVRIQSAPAESQVQTYLSREFAFPGREAAVFRGCPGPGRAA
jgi:hypothetical protein